MALLTHCGLLRCAVRCYSQRVRELRELAASKKAEADASRASHADAAAAIAHQPVEPPSDVTQPHESAEHVATDALAGSEQTSQRPTSLAPHRLPLHTAAVLALPADFFDADTSEEPRGSAEQQPTHPATTTDSATKQLFSAERDSTSTVTAIQHPTASLPQAGEGEQLSALLDAEHERSQEAQADAERERLDTEAAIALAVALSQQQSQPAPQTTPPTSSSVVSSSARPASPVPAPGIAAVLVPDALEAFEAELAVAEAEAKERSTEEEGRLARMRRDMEQGEDDDRKQRLDSIKQRVAEAKRKRTLLQQQRPPAEGGDTAKQSRPKKRKAETADRLSVEDTGNDNDLMAELDGMFDWRRQPR